MVLPNSSFGVFWKTYAPTIVKVTKKIGDSKTILIDFTPIHNVSSYNIYGSLSPSSRKLIYSTPPNSNPPFEIKIPISNRILPDELIFYFWVSYIRNSNEVFIEDNPAMFFTAENRFSDMYNKFSPKPTNCMSPMGYVRATIPYEMMEFYMNEIRRRHITVLEIGGEEFLLFKRRFEGDICPNCYKDPKVMGNITQIGENKPIPFDPTITTEEGSPRYQGRTNCEECYGTGIVGGYYYPITIKVGYQGIPRTEIRMQEQGLEFVKKPDAWTVWSPTINQHDILHRIITGERFIVSDVKTATWRGVITRQQLTFNSIPPNDIRITITKEKIESVLNKYLKSEEYVEFPQWV